LVHTVPIYIGAIFIYGVMLRVQELQKYILTDIFVKKNYILQYLCYIVLFIFFQKFFSPLDIILFMLQYQTLNVHFSTQIRTLIFTIV
jgi:hypothetical protein